jgi:hypothetical protein
MTGRRTHDVERTKLRINDVNGATVWLADAGIGRGGTVAAGEFLVDQRHIDEMLHMAPSDWKCKNLEIVLETQVIQSHSGPPRISAAYVW